MLGRVLNSSDSLEVIWWALENTLFSLCFPKFGWNLFTSRENKTFTNGIFSTKPVY